MPTVFPPYSVQQALTLPLGFARQQVRGRWNAAPIHVGRHDAQPSRLVAALDRLWLFILRMLLVLMVVQGGAVIVRNVTLAMCTVVHHTPPAWTHAAPVLPLGRGIGR